MNWTTVSLCGKMIHEFPFQLQKSKEREERLEEVIQAYEKIHLEKSNVQRDLDKMVRFFLYFDNDGKEQGLLLFDHDFVFVRQLWQSSIWRGSAVWSRL